MNKTENHVYVIGDSEDIAIIDISTKKHPGTFTLVDADQLEWVIDGNGVWYANDGGRDKSPLYADRTRKSDGTTQKLHRVLLGAPDDMDVNHINDFRLDNRLSNLELVDRA